MNERPLGSSGLTVGAVGMGCMYLSIRERPSEDDAVRTLHAALDAGVTFLDTADVYCIDHRDIGHSERTIARALREKKNGSVVVATKGGLERPNGAWPRKARAGRASRRWAWSESTCTSSTRPTPRCRSPRASGSWGAFEPKERSLTWG